MQYTKKENLSGKTFGNLFVLDIKKDINYKTHWLCRCVCGQEKYINGASLCLGRTKSCGCTTYKRISSYSTYIGKIFGKLKVIDFIKKNKGYNLLCKCLDCNKEIKVNSLRVLKRNVNGCIECHRGRNNKGYIVRQYRFTRIKSAAKTRKISFDVTKDYLEDLYIKQNGVCALSGIKLTMSDKGATASLDRIDSKKGYIEGNVQWVHRDINWMKMNFNQKKFYILCKLVIKNLKDIYE